VILTKAYVTNPFALPFTVSFFVVVVLFLFIFVNAYQYCKIPDEAALIHIFSLSFVGPLNVNCDLKSEYETVTLL